MSLQFVFAWRARLRRLTYGLVRVFFSLGLAATVAGLERGPAPAQAAGPFLVVNPADEPDITPGDAICAGTSNLCTLRAAIEEANALGGPIQVFLPSDPGPITYTLSLGSLPVRANMSLQSFQGAGPRVIDGAGMVEPVFDMGAASVQLAGITIRRGGQGILVQAGAGLALENATLTANSNTGIINQGTLTITNTTISGNSGGGIVNDGAGVIHLVNTTVASNTASVTSGGIDNKDGTLVVITNSILAGNASTLRPDNCAGLIQSGGHNLVAYADDTQNSQSCSYASGTGDQVGTHASPLDARLGPLQANGGPSLTHALLAGSLAVDQAASDGCPTRDQRGVNRKQGNQWQGAGCDAGAFELPVARLSSSVFSAAETAGLAVVTATLDVSVAFALTAHFSTTDGAAEAGADYAPVVNGDLTFGPGSLIATGTVPITFNSLYTGDRWFSVALTDTVDIGAAAPTSAVVRLLDAQPAPTVTFTSGAYASPKSAGSVMVTATLSSMSGVTATVPYSTADGTALAGQDYVAKTGAFTFPPGITVQTATITLLNDGHYHGDRDFSLTLSPPFSATVGSPGAAAITILDDNPRRLYLPMVASPYIEHEPNDFYDQATGPLERGKAYTAANKGNGNSDVDYFFFEATSVGTIVVDVANLAYGAQVSLRYSTRGSYVNVGYAGAPPFRLQSLVIPGAIPVPGLGGIGTYYIVVFTPGDYTGGPYSVTVTYP